MCCTLRTIRVVRYVLLAKNHELSYSIIINNSVIHGYRLGESLPDPGTLVWQPLNVDDWAVLHIIKKLKFFPHKENVNFPLKKMIYFITEMFRSVRGFGWSVLYPTSGPWCCSGRRGQGFYSPAKCESEEITGHSNNIFWCGSSSIIHCLHI